ncbi:MAG: pyridoxal phosphate-dependent aminotransferase [Candidatus Levybacteria bacterium]|nr:pyridoxal phosphate-dependent aminotransferase [Candidatus Levybacteria bacterium]
MISKRAQRIAPSATLAVGAKALEMKKQGIDVVSFGAGEPDFDTPEHIKKAAIAALAAGFTKYTPSSGIAELKEAVCRKFKEDNGLVYGPEQVMVSNGAKQCIYNMLQVLIDPGDEVLVPVPYWVSYEEMVKLADGKSVFISPQKGLKIDAKQIEKHATRKTKALILNSPANPTGMVYDKKELEAIADICIKKRIYVISDEVYEKLIYGKKHVSIASLGQKIKDLTITVSGVSKTYSMTGWRIGYCAGPEEIIQAAGRIQDHTTANPNSIAQKAAIVALSGPQKNIPLWKKEYVKRRDYMVKRLSKMPGISFQTPEAGFFIFANVSKLYKDSIKDSLTFCDTLLNKAHVAVVPGVAFGDDRYIRLSFATSMEQIKRGLDRIGAFVST